MDVVVQCIPEMPVVPFYAIDDEGDSLLIIVDMGRPHNDPFRKHIRGSLQVLQIMVLIQRKGLHKVSDRISRYIDKESFPLDHETDPFAV